MNDTRVRSQNGANLGAKHSRADGPASICNDEWSRFGASPFGPGGPGRWGSLRRLPGPLARAARRAYPSALGHSGAGAIQFGNTL